MLKNWETVEVTADKFAEVRGSYSGDTISNSKTVRRPFKFQGKLYVSTGGVFGGNSIPHEEAYQLVPREQFSGKAAYYGKGRKGEYGDWAANRREQPEGFHHGMLIKRGNSEWVLAGPPLTFVVKQGSVSSTQLELM